MSIIKQSVQMNVKKKNVHVIIAIMILTSIVAFIVFFKTDIFTVKFVEVYGNHKLKKSDIIEESGITIKNHILKEKIENIKKNLRSNPYIKDVVVKRKMPNKIIIQIDERIEEAAISFIDTYLIIDNEGTVLRSSLDSEMFKIISGVEFQQCIEGEKLNTKNGEEFNKALEIIKGMNSIGISIKEVNVSEKNNIIIKLTDDLICKIGPSENLDYRLIFVKNMLKDLEQREITRGIIDMSHNGYPTYRPIE
ncbi:FtsQ-type POTRA domain-containing protein [Lutibacter sp. B2]|nr:FtsQ-type POTRA domain-containing protein [Lutibacter sp. B2]